MLVIPIITIACLLISLIADRKKTWQGLKKAGKKLLKISSLLVLILILVSLLLYFLPGDAIADYLNNDNLLISFLLALLLGAIAMLPGFIAFPLSGILKANDVPYLVISAFTSSLMMVGILTFPVEKKYFGFKVALLRNIISLLTAAIVALVTGLFFREILV